MRVQKQACTTDGSLFHFVRPQSLHQHKIRFQPPNTFAEEPQKLHSTASSARDEAPKQPMRGFVLNTVHTVQKNERPFRIRKGNLESGAAETDSILERPSKRRTLKWQRPVKISDKVNSDIWQTILGYCPPGFLLEAKTINSEFYNLLAQRSAIWKESRQRHFGFEMPDCPSGLTEQKYADLLCGKGCQNSSCPKEIATRVYWVFKVRLCATCFKQKTIRVCNEARPSEAF
jgi:hypothetical protein